jgi:hypothetical protein
MVLREQCANRMEGEGVPLVDSWKTYVFRTTDEFLTSNNLLIVTAGAGKEHTSVCHNFMGMLFEVIHRAY